MVMLGGDGIKSILAVAALRRLLLFAITKATERCHSEMLRTDPKKLL
jgi:hypothetical protein